MGQRPDRGLIEMIVVIVRDQHHVDAGQLLERAIARVKTQVSPKQFQIFDCYVVKDWGVSKVMQELDVSMAQVYLAKHRVGKLLKHELSSLEKPL